MNFRTNLIIGVAAGLLLCIMGLMSSMDLKMVVGGGKLEVELAVVAVWVGGVAAAVFGATLFLWERAGVTAPQKGNDPA